MRVSENGVEVNTTLHQSISDIRSFLSKHRAWIIRNYEKSRKRLAELPVVADGAMVPFQGEFLRVESSAVDSGFIDGVFKFVSTGAESIDKAILKQLTDAYVAAAIDVLGKLRVKWTPSFPVLPRVVFRLKEMGSRWGSCSSTGAISINWRLIMARPEVFEYVFIHEACHLSRRGHDRSFWREVQQHIPSFRCLRAELRCDNYMLMNFPFKSGSPKTLAVIA
jgi:predicted metal-dependent hydrolase